MGIHLNCSRYKNSVTFNTIESYKMLHVFFGIFYYISNHNSIDMMRYGVSNKQIISNVLQHVYSICQHEINVYFIQMCETLTNMFTIYPSISCLWSTRTYCWCQVCVCVSSFIQCLIVYCKFETCASYFLPVVVSTVLVAVAVSNLCSVS